MKTRKYKNHEEWRNKISSTKKKIWEEKRKKEIIEIELTKILGLDEEERDDNVNYYVPFCIVGEDENKKQVQIFLNWDNLITLALKIKPYLDSYEAQSKLDEEMLKDYQNNICEHKNIEKGFVDGGACGETCKDCGKSWRSTWQGD